MSEYKIEKHIPVAPPWNAQRRSKYPFKDMEVGDSFFVPEDAATRAAIYLAAHKAEKEHAGKKFQATAVEGGMRVWRTQ